MLVPKQKYAIAIVINTPSAQMERGCAVSKFSSFSLLDSGGRF